MQIRELQNCSHVKVLYQCTPSAQSSRKILVLHTIPSIPQVKSIALEGEFKTLLLKKIQHIYLFEDRAQDISLNFTYSGIFYESATLSSAFWSREVQEWMGEEEEQQV